MGNNGSVPQVSHDEKILSFALSGSFCGLCIRAVSVPCTHLHSFQPFPCFFLLSFLERFSMVSRRFRKPTKSYSHTTATHPHKLLYGITVAIRHFDECLTMSWPTAKPDSCQGCEASMRKEVWLVVQGWSQQYTNAKALVCSARLEAVLLRNPSSKEITSTFLCFSHAFFTWLNSLFFRNGYVSCGLRRLCHA